MQPSNSCIAGEASLDSTFPKSLRLRKRADFLRLSGSTDKITVKGFLLVWQVSELAQARLGITVSKKVGCAVIRNRLKRCIREIFRHNQHLLSSVDMNVIARRDSATMDFSTVRRELEKAFRFIGKPSCSRALRSF